MGIYSPMRDTFRELNRLLIDKQQWDARHALNAEDQKTKNILLKAQLEDKAQQRRFVEGQIAAQGQRQKVLNFQAQQAEHQMEEIPLHMTDIINPENPEMLKHFETTQQDTARSFTGDPDSYFDENSGNLMRGDGTQFTQSRSKYAPAMAGYLTRFGFQRSPEVSVQNQIDANEFEIETNQELLDNAVTKNGRKFIPMGQTGRAGAHWTGFSEATRLVNRNKSLRQDIGKMGLMLKSKQWKTNAYRKKQELLTAGLQEVLAFGADPTLAYKSYNGEMNRITGILKRIEEGPKASSVTEKLYASYVQDKKARNTFFKEKGLPLEEELPFHEWDIEHKKRLQKEAKPSRKQEIIAGEKALHAAAHKERKAWEKEENRLMGKYTTAKGRAKHIEKPGKGSVLDPVYDTESLRERMKIINEKNIIASELKTHREKEDTSKWLKSPVLPKSELTKRYRAFVKTGKKEGITFRELEDAAFKIWDELSDDITTGRTHLDLVAAVGQMESTYKMKRLDALRFIVNELNKGNSQFLNEGAQITVPTNQPNPDLSTREQEFVEKQKQIRR